MTKAPWVDAPCSVDSSTSTGERHQRGVCTPPATRAASHEDPAGVDGATEHDACVMGPLTGWGVSWFSVGKRRVRAAHHSSRIMKPSWSGVG
jgi:hypothetical protein